MTGEQSPPSPKPQELRELTQLLRPMFDKLKAACEIEDSYTFSLRSVDCLGAGLTDPKGIAAFTLRKLQALHYMAQDGVRTTNHVVVCTIADIHISLTVATASISDGRDDIRDYLLAGRDRIDHAGRAVSKLHQGDLREMI